MNHSVKLGAAGLRWGRCCLLLLACLGGWATTTAAVFPALPDAATGVMPARLASTGVFADTARLTPASALLPYDLRVSFWSDGAVKRRWAAVPAGHPAGFAAAGPWVFPAGTVFVKHFEIAEDETRPDRRRRLETRLLVRAAAGGVYGLVYKWRADGADADLLATNLSETITIRTVAGVRTQNWYYPSRADCLQCHNEAAGGVLGVKTAQLNGEWRYPGGGVENQLLVWSRGGMLAPAVTAAELDGLPRLAAAHDLGRGLEDRARSYLDANCAACHRPGVTVGNFDARYETPLPRQNLLNGPVLIDQGLDGARVVAPNDPWRSVLYLRAGTVEGMKMPPLAHGVVDAPGVALLREWITSLPGPPVLSPPAIQPRGGNFREPVQVTLSAAEAGAEMHYTLDGSAPNKSDPVYSVPFTVSGPSVVRARAYRPGWTRSITSQEIFLIGD